MLTETPAPATTRDDPFDRLRLELRQDDAGRRRRGRLATALGVAVLVVATTIYGGSQALGLFSVIGSAVVSTPR